MLPVKRNWGRVRMEKEKRTFPPKGSSPVASVREVQGQVAHTFKFSAQEAEADRQTLMWPGLSTVNS